MSEKKKVNMYFRAILSLAFYLALFAWLNQFKFSGFDSKGVPGDFSILQRVAVLIYLFLGMFTHLIAGLGNRFKQVIIFSTGYAIFACVMYSISSLVSAPLVAGLLILLTAIFFVISCSWLRKIKANELQIKNFSFHMILCLSLQLVLYNCQSYSNIMFLAITLHLIFTFICKFIYSTYSQYTSPLHTIALLICKQNFSYSGLFALSVVFSLILAALPGQLLKSHDLTETYVLAHSWYLNFLLFVVMVMVLLLASHSVNADFVNKNIYTIASKPLSRLAYIVGKFLGIVLVAGPFLIYFSVVFLLLINFAVYLAPKEENSGNYELLAVSEILEPNYLGSEVFNLSVKRAMEADGLSSDSEKYREKYVKQQIEAYKFIPYLEKRTYHFELPDRIHGDFKDPILVKFTPRFKMEEHSATLKLKVWINDRLYRGENDSEFIVTESNREVSLSLNDYLDIDPDSVKVELMNYSGYSFLSGKRMTVYLGKYSGKGLVLAVEDRSYIANSLKLVAVMFVQICFAATLALFAVSMLDFSVAILFASSLLIIAYGHDFINDAIEYDTGLDRSKTILESIQFRWRIVIDSYEDFGFFGAFKSIIANFMDGFISLMPSFKSFRLIADFSRGVYIDLGMFFRLILTLGVFWTPLHFLLSIFAINKREPARLVI